MVFDISSLNSDCAFAQNCTIHFFVSIRVMVYGLWSVCSMVVAAMHGTVMGICFIVYCSHTGYWTGVAGEADVTRRVHHQR